MKHLILLFLFILVQTICVAQTQTINQYNQNGKREGLWLLYLDKTWKEVKDTNTATFKAYEKFLNGFPIYADMGGKIKLRIEGPIDSINKFLNGTYKFYDKKNRLVSVDSFINGEILSTTKYERSGTVWFSNYRIIYKNEPFSYAIYFYSHITKTTHFLIFRKGTRNWANYEWDKNDPDLHKRLIGNLRSQVIKP